MTQEATQKIRAEAIAWRIRLRDDRADDWDAFVDWLEADPTHADAYDAVALADADLRPEVFPPMPAGAANDDFVESAWSRRRWATALTAVAAIVILALLLVPMLALDPSRYEVVTAAGQRRTVPIGDGSSAMLNGGTRIVLDRDNPRYAELAAGEAIFTVRHDSAAPFVVVSGDHQVRDVGTTFNLVREGDRFSVEVIEGAVLYNRGRTAVPLAAGQTLIVTGGRAIVGRRDPQTMAGWRRGQLSYTSTPLETVAADLARSLGAEISVDPSVATMRFTGSIRIDQDAGSTVTGLAATLGLQARRIGDRWLIEPRSRANR